MKMHSSGVVIVVQANARTPNRTAVAVSSGVNARRQRSCHVLPSELLSLQVRGNRPYSWCQSLHIHVTYKLLNPLARSIAPPTLQLCCKDIITSATHQPPSACECNALSMPYLHQSAARQHEWCQELAAYRILPVKSW